MNLLLIDTVVPPSVFSGKSVRLFGIYGRLAKRHRVTFVRPAPVAGRKQSEDVEGWCREHFAETLFLKPLPRAAFKDRLFSVLRCRPYYDLPAKYPVHSQAVREELLEIIKSRKIDAVITFSVEAASYGYLVRDVCPWLQDLTDSMVLQMRRRLKKAETLKARLDLRLRLLRETGFEREMVQAARRTLFVADDDLALYRSLAVEINSNGVDLDYFNPASVEPVCEKNPYVVFTGHMNFPPNVDAAVYFAREILPQVRKIQPDLNFKIVGADPVAEVEALREIPGVEVTGRVPDLRSYLAGAAAFVCPMRMGSGIKNKLLEAMAMNLPVVATKLALDGMQYVPAGLEPSAAGEHEFAQGTLKALTQARLGSAGLREHVMRHYSWDSRVDEFDRCLQRITGQGVTTL